MKDYATESHKYINRKMFGRIMKLFFPANWINMQKRMITIEDKAEKYCIICLKGER